MFRFPTIARRGRAIKPVLFQLAFVQAHHAVHFVGEFVKLVRGEGSAALVATHNERLAYKMDRVVRLHEGKLE